MDPSDSPHPSPDMASALADELRLLRKYLVVTLAAGVLVTFCVNIYLYQEDRTIRAQNHQARELERNTGLALTAFLNQVVSYGNTNPGVAQILAKYGIKPPATNVAPTGASMPAK
jgi:hypothetical protein